MIEELINQLAEDEGTVKNDNDRHIVYKCPAGKYTVGYGIEVEEHGLSEDEARMLLRQRILDVIKEVDNNYPFIKISPLPIKLCFYNMAFNLGITRLSKFRKMIAALEVGDYVTAGKEAQDSQWHNQVGARAERIVKAISECSEKDFT